MEMKAKLKMCKNWNETEIKLHLFMCMMIDLKSNGCRSQGLV